MNTDRCSYGGRACGRDGIRCVLREGVKSQGKMGAPDANDPTVGGPNWPSETWDTYTRDVQQQADTRGCRKPDGVRRTIQRVTSAKKKRGEFK